jgi:hypothetical protein
VEEIELQDEKKYDTVEAGKLEEGAECLTSCMNPPHWRYRKCQNASHKSNRFRPWIIVAPEDNHHALMAQYRVSDSSGEVAFLYYLHRSRC